MRAAFSFLLLAALACTARAGFDWGAVTSQSAKQQGDVRNLGENRGIKDAARRHSAAVRRSARRTGALYGSKGRVGTLARHVKRSVQLSLPPPLFTLFRPRSTVIR